MSLGRTWPRLATLGLLAAFGAGCSEEGTAVSGETRVRLMLSVSTAALAGEQLVLLPHYRRTDQTRIDLPPSTVALGSAQTQQIPLDLEITGCLRDPLRESVGEGCPLRLAAVLRSASGVTVDSQLVGPFVLVPGATITTPPITLRAFGSVVLSARPDTVNPGGTTQIGLTVKDRQGGDLGPKPAGWTSSAPAVATVSATGLVAGLAPGVATITAALTADPAVKASVPIAVRGIVSFSIGPDSVSLRVNDSIVPANSIAVVGVPGTVRWRSRAPTVAAVDLSRGLVTAIAPGRAIIVAQPAADTAKADSVVISVAGVVSVATSPRSALLSVNGTVTLTTTVVALGGISAAVTYASSAPTIATVSGSGQVTAVAPGDAVIRVVSTGDPSKRDSAAVRVFASPANAACASGTFVVDTIRTAARLGKAGSPYRLPVDLVVTANAVLTIDPGVTICADRGVTLSMERGGSLIARGTPTERIRFTATDPVTRWDGLRFANIPVTDSSVISDAVLEYGSLPPMTVWTSQHPVVYDGVRFRQWAGAAVELARGRISRSAIDTVIGGEAAVYLGQGAKFEATTVRQADSIGVYAADTVQLLGGSIQQAAVGLVNLVGSRPPAGYQPVRIVANRGVPARLDPDWIARIAPDSLSQASFLGNAIDAIATSGTLTRNTIRVFGHLGLIVSGLVIGEQAVLIARPGARIELIPDPAHDRNGFISFYDGGLLDARGSVANPVVFSARDPGTPFDGIFFFGTQSGAPLGAPLSDTTRLINTIVQFGGGSGAALQFSTAGLPAIIDSTRVRQSQGAGIQVAFARGPAFLIETSSVEATVKIVRTRVDTAGSRQTPAVLLLASSTMTNSVVRGARGTGIGLAEGVVDSVTVTGSGLNGVEILTVGGTIGPLSIQRSNLVNNAGVGLNNANLKFPIGVPNIWWGDVEGPFGSFGDGISGAADFAPAATEPIGLNTPFPLPPIPPNGQFSRLTPGSEPPLWFAGRLRNQPDRVSRTGHTIPWL